MEKFIHSVTLDKDLCKGCINCIKRCPTEAIRVRDGKAHILAERCITAASASASVRIMQRSRCMTR